MLESLLTPRQVAEILAVQPVTVYAAAANGKLPYVRLWEGRRRALIRFRREDIEKLIREQALFSQK